MAAQEGAPLCPRCGAYWACDCEPMDAAAASPEDDRCEHDWGEVVGVDLEREAYPEGVRVVICRRCGLYAVRSDG